MTSKDFILLMSVYVAKSVKNEFVPSQRRYLGVLIFNVVLILTFIFSIDILV